MGMIAGKFDLTIRLTYGIIWPINERRGWERLSLSWLTATLCVWCETEQYKRLKIIPEPQSEIQLDTGERGAVKRARFWLPGC